MSITRRLFLRHTASAGVVAAVAAPVAAAEPEMTPREKALWHMRELERLILADGASTVTIIACGMDYDGIEHIDHCKSAMLGTEDGFHHGGMFAPKGGDA